MSAPESATTALERHRPTVVVNAGLMDDADTMSRLSPVARRDRPSCVRRNSTSSTHSTAVMAALDKQNWLLRRSLGQRVHNQLKTVPEIQFFLDDSLEYIDNIDQLLREEK